MKTHKDSYLADYNYCLIVYWNFCQAQLQEIDMTQILIDYVNASTFG